jgi:L-seryl-tRNA(Ser) seleniumtransferase
VAIKPPELLNRLPSVSELLEKPPIRALAERWNKSVVAAGVKSFLNDLQNDLRRRAAEVQLPSLRELAERAASYVVSHQQQSLGAAINATGRIWGSPWTSRPMSDAALERAAAVGREFAMDAAIGVPAAAFEASICRLTGGQAAAAVHSYSGAIWLALAALAAEREVLISRSDVGDLGRAESLPKLAASAKCILREVGTTNRATAADYEAAVSPRAAAILRVKSEEYRIVGDTADVAVEVLVPLARDRELSLIDCLGPAPLIDPPAEFGPLQQTVRAVLAAGVDLAIVRGDGLIGGPTCGILVGNRDFMQRITEHLMFTTWRLDAPRAAALTATVQSYENTERGAEALPLWQLLTTPVENLRNRAERIAPQLANAAGIASAAAFETRSPLSSTLALDGGRASYAIALSPSEGGASQLDKRLCSLPLPIIGRIEGDRVVLDLRTVLPRQDRALVESIVGAPTGAPTSDVLPTDAPQAGVRGPI